MNLTAIILALALGGPALFFAVSRIGPVRRAASSMAGIALQTVIIIVVMLLIAGGVSAVLLSRGQEAIGELEAASIAGVNVSNCTRVEHTIKTTKSKPGELSTDGKKCTLRFDGQTPALVTGDVTTATCSRIDRRAVKSSDHGGLACEVVFS